jgi:hypothetical protein
MTASGRTVRNTSSAARLRMSNVCMTTPSGASGHGREVDADDAIPARGELFRDDAREQTGFRE